MASVESIIQPKSARLSVLSELLGEIPYGRAILILFDPDAQTTSFLVNVTADYLRGGGDAIYFSDCQPVPELREMFKKLGLNVAEYEARDSAVLFDVYSAQMGSKSVEKYRASTFNLNELSIGMAKSATQWPPGSLAVYESFSNMAFGQEAVLAKFCRKAISIWRGQGTIMINGFALGLHPPSFYQEMKLLSNAVVELKLEEYEGEIVSTIRALSFKGRKADTRLRRIVFDDKMKVTLDYMKTPRESNPRR